MTHRSTALQRRVNHILVGHLHKLFFCLMLEGTIEWLRAYTVLGHRVQTHTGAMGVFWLRSTGTAEVPTRQWEQQNATLVPLFHQCTHRHTYPDIHKSRKRPTVPYSHAHNDTLTAELTQMHSWARLYRLNRCRSLEEAGLCSRNICPPKAPVYIPHWLEARRAVHMHAVVVLMLNFVLTVAARLSL